MQDDISDLKGDLHAIAEVLGRQKALYLVSKCSRYKVEKRQGAGQLLLYVPKLKNFDLKHNLVQMMGYEDAYKLSQHFGGELLTLSQCKQIILKNRNLGIKAMLQQGFKKEQIAEFFDLTPRAVCMVASGTN